MEDQNELEQYVISGQAEQENRKVRKGSVPPALAIARTRTYFKPGNSGNPAGRPKTRLIRDSLIRQLKAKSSKKIIHKTKLDELVGALIAQAKGGNVSALREINDRLDGKVIPSQEELDATRQPLQVVISQGLRPKHEELPVSTDSDAVPPVNGGE